MLEDIENASKFPEEAAYLEELATSKGKYFAAAVAAYVEGRVELSQLAMSGASPEKVVKVRDSVSTKCATLTVLSKRRPEEVIEAGDKLVELFEAHMNANDALKKAKED